MKRFLKSPGAIWYLLAIANLAAGVVYLVLEIGWDLDPRDTDYILRAVAFFALGQLSEIGYALGIDVKKPKEDGEE